MTRPAADDEGYALVAAVASLIVFALVALMVIEAGRGAIVSASAEIGRARALAAAEAGAAIAVDDLLAGRIDPRALDGRARATRFRDARLVIRIEDESGKIPLNALEDDDVRRMLELLGLSGDPLEIATDSYLDWTDDDDDPRPNGAERDYYAPRHIHPRNGLLRSVGEVAQIRGFTPALANRLEEVATVHFGRSSFDPSRASLFAIRVMEGDEQGAIDLIERQRVLAGQESALPAEAGRTLVGQPLTLRVTAALDDGARASLRELIVLTGRAAQPYVVVERD